MGDVRSLELQERVVEGAVDDAAGRLELPLRIGGLEVERLVDDERGARGRGGALRIRRGDGRDYVINVLDTGAPADGVDVLTICGADTTDGAAIAAGLDCDYATRLAPQTPPLDPTKPYADDIFLLRRTSFIAKGGESTQNELADRPAFVAVLHTDLLTAAPAGPALQTSFDVERIHYDTAINGPPKV